MPIQRVTITTPQNKVTPAQPLQRPLVTAATIAAQKAATANAVSGSGSFAYQTDTFTGDGSTAAFTLSFTPSGAVALHYQPATGEAFLRYNPADVTLVNNVITLTNTPANGSTLLVDYIYAT